MAGLRVEARRRAPTLRHETIRPSREAHHQSQGRPRRHVAALAAEGQVPVTCGRVPGRGYNALMRVNRLFTSRVLASTLIRVLPRGWCCIFAALVVKPNPVKRCCCPSKPSMPKPVKFCPCGDRDTVLTQQHDLPAADLLPCAMMLDPPEA